jgi:hypothetical protein
VTPDPAIVAARLDALRALYEAAKPNSVLAPFARAVAARLEELRALDDLTRYLHRSAQR